jgi:thiol-disulfide isomerase/thioredoxin
MSASRSRWAALGLLVLAGFGIMFALRATHVDADARMVDLLNRQPVALSAFVDADGAEVPIESFRGRIVILNLWAPWCVPCLKEMPSLDRLAAALPADKFAVVAVTQDPPGDSPSKRLFDKLGLEKLKLYLDPSKRLADEIGARGFPATLIIGPDGAALAFREGAADWDSEAMRAKLDALLKRAAPL